MIDDVKELLSVGSKIREAIEATDVVKKRMRARMKEYNSMLHVLLQSGSPDKFKSELQRLHDIYHEIEALHVKHTAGPEDPRWVRFAKKINRGTQHKSIEEDLDAIDGEALQLFTAIAAKSSIDNSKAIRQILQDLKLEGRSVSTGSKLLVAGGVCGAVFVVLAALALAHRDEEAPVDVLKAVELVLRDFGPDRARVSDGTQLFVVGLFGTLVVVFGAVMTAQRNAVFSMIRGTLPPTLPDKAAVPAGALALPHSYVERPCVREAADGLINPETALAPYKVVGMGGGGKTVLASAIVRDPSVREHFRGGIFWASVGRNAKRSLLPLLQALAREIAAAPTDAPHGVPHALDSLEQVKQHLAAAAASTGTSPRLVVLDDVWEREVVDAFLPLKLKVLVTTRDHSVVGVPGGRLELGDMTEDEALELLQKTSLAVGRPGVDARAQMAKVTARCGRLPLGLAIAGSMPIVKGKGLTAGAWAKLVKELENVAKKMRARGEQSTSLKLVLETSLDALSARKQEEFLKMAVMAAGAVAPIEMLLNLWEIQDVEGTREEADGLVSKCLLQGVGDDGYRVHDLVLEVMKLNVKADTEMVKNSTALQAQYLSRLEVVQGYGEPRHGGGMHGLFSLDALWRSVEELSGDPALEVNSYCASLKELESCEETEHVAKSYAQVGSLFYVQGKYAEAQPLLERCQAIGEKVLGPGHPLLAIALNNLATLLTDQGKYAEAQPLYEQCQAVQEKMLGPEHPSLATTFSNWGSLLEMQGKYDEAEPLYIRAIAIGEKTLGPDSRLVAESLNNRATLLLRQGKYDEAEPLLNRAIAIGEKALGPDHPLVATMLGNRGELLLNQGKCAEAEPLFERCQAIQEKVLGPEHPSLAPTLHNRAFLLGQQGKYDAAEPLSVRAVTIGEKAFGPDHPDLATLLGSRANLLHCQGKYAEAQPLYERSQEIQEKVLGPEHSTSATTLHNLAMSLENQGKYDEAKPLFNRAIAIGEKALGPDHANVATMLGNRAVMLLNQGKYSEAQPLYERCQAIQEKVLGPGHPLLATTLNILAMLLVNQGKYDEAEPLYIRAFSIEEKALGPDHPLVAESLNNRATLLLRQGKCAEAEPLFERCQAIQEKVLDPEHPSVARTLNNRAFLLGQQGKYDAAEPLSVRAVAIGEKASGPDHPILATLLCSRANLLHSQGKFDQAEPLFIRAIAIGEKTMGPDHPKVAMWRVILVMRQEENAAGPQASRAADPGQHRPDVKEFSEAMLLLQRALSIREKKGEIPQA